MWSWFGGDGETGYLMDGMKGIERNRSYQLNLL
jgi:hypothetical protein